jgi:hydroxyethylthiazole kinase
MSELIHCITNPISMMQCANAVLALGEKPIMAEHPLEVKDITNSASALLINLGNISDSRMEAMRISYEAALFKGLPIVLDAVGVACSELRRNFALELIEKRDFLLIKGNNSEIKALADGCYRGKGVDADTNLSEKEMIEISRELAEKLNVIVLCSGEKDIVTDGKTTALISNGTPKMGDITGTGCMLGAICAGFLAKEKTIYSIIKACAFFGIAGEMAEKRISGMEDNEEICFGKAGKNSIGSGSFLIGLLDAISLINDETIEKYKKVEYI